MSKKEQTYDYTDEFHEDDDFKAAFLGTLWGIFSIILMLGIVGFAFGFFAGLVATTILLFIYIGFMVISW